jgi:prolyl-tRNA synthetase
VQVDRRDLGGGVKDWEWIKKGVPIRVELGPARSGIRQCRGHYAVISREIKGVLSDGGVRARAAAMLESIQQDLLDRAKEFRDANTRAIDTKEEFYDFFTPKNAEKPEIHGGFALAHWSGSREVEEQIKADLKVTIRCIPFQASEPGTCPFTGAASQQRVVWAKSY